MGLAHCASSPCHVLDRSPGVFRLIRRTTVQWHIVCILSSECYDWNPDFASLDHSFLEMRNIPPARYAARLELGREVALLLSHEAENPNPTRAT